MLKKLVVLAALGTTILLTNAQAKASDSQYCDIYVIPPDDHTILTVKNFHQTWGHWYTPGATNSESNNFYEGAQSHGWGDDILLGARGDTGSGYGVDGYFDVYDGNTKVCGVHFISPASGTNVFEILEVNKAYTVEAMPFEVIGQQRTIPTSGPLGKVRVYVEPPEKP